MDKLKGMTRTVLSNKKAFLLTSAVAVFAAIFSACGGPAASGPGGVDPNETAAKVNGKVITMQEVDRAVKAQAQGQESRLSPLELAGARLQVLDTLIQQEVMFQKAEKEATVPSEDDITVEINKQKTASGKTADQIAKDMADQGMTEAALRDQVKKIIAIQKLTDKITGKIEPPKDSEIDAFYNGNKEAFVKKRGVKLAAIILDPANSGPGDTTTDEQTSALKGNEVIKKLQGGQDFASLAREYSEDDSKLQGGDLGYIAEDQLKQMFPPQIAGDLMNPATPMGKMMITQSQGKFFVLKLQDRSDKDEALTLESPGVREKVQQSLVDNRKQLLAASYQAVAMNEAKIENFLAKKVVDNPNELSGARPAGAANAATPAPANTNTAAPANTNSNAAAPANTAANASAKPAANAPAKPAANAPAKPAANK
jgi:parvulin-like peptidyl-prolyl isomerase